MSFTGVHIRCKSTLVEVLIAEMSMLPFDAFQESEGGFSAYCESYDAKELKRIIQKYEEMGDEISYTVETIPRVNWNEDWEKNFDPVEVSSRLRIRAPFHQPGNHPFEIIIQPKMSFGTGHHQTTRLMLLEMMEHDLKDQTVIDLGCGTGVLSILASKLGAKRVLAADIDPWCIGNCRENFELNGCEGVEVIQGTVRTLKEDERADFVLANINKNVLINEFREYVHVLNAPGRLVLSGFYKADVPDLLSIGRKEGLTHVGDSQLDEWAVLVFEKSRYNRLT